MTPAAAPERIAAETPLNFSELTVFGWLDWFIGKRRPNPEAPTRFELVMEVLQTSALPLGDGAENGNESYHPSFGCQLGPTGAVTMSGRQCNDYLIR